MRPALSWPTQVLRYLGRYTHRVAISNHRLLAFDGERVTFRWKDYAHGSKQGKMTLSGADFLRRFAQHILPRGFVRIRQYGFLANRCRAANLNVARQLLTTTPTPPEACSNSAADAPTWRCPQCGAAMQIGANLTARQLAQRCKFFDSS
jgi:Putative transposase